MASRRQYRVGLLGTLVLGGGVRHAMVRFAPARGPQSPADVVPFKIVARSEIHTDVSDLVPG